MKVFLIQKNKCFQKFMKVLIWTSLFCILRKVFYFVIFHTARFHNCLEFGVALFDSFLLFSVSVRNYQVLVWVCSECFNTESWLAYWFNCSRFHHTTWEVSRAPYLTCICIFALELFGPILLLCVGYNVLMS